MAIVAALFLVFGCETPATNEKAEASALRGILLKAAATSNGNHDYAAAGAVYRTLYTNDSDDVEAALGLARSLRYTGSFDQATEVLDQSLGQRPDNVELLTEQGKLHLVLRDPDAAIEALDRAKELGSTNWQTYSSLGIAYDLLARFAQARASYGEALAISSENPAILNNLALSWAQFGDLDRAITILKGPAAAPRAGVQERQNLALLYALKGEHHKVQDLVQRDLGEEVTGNNLKYYQWLGAALDQPVDVAGAIRADVPQAASANVQYLAQFAAYRDPAQADRAWDRLRQKFPDILEGLNHQLRIIALGAKQGDFYRLQAGSFSSHAAAIDVCDRLILRNQECMVIQR